MLVQMELQYMNDYVDRTVKAIDDGQLPQWITDHVREYQESSGKRGHLWDSTAVGGSGLAECLLLTTVGRSTGRTYTHPLLYGLDGDRVLIVASKGGADTHPQWYFNLLAAPRVTVQIASEIFPASARLAEGPERDRVWSIVTITYPPYIDYQAQTTRQIPVFILERCA